ncbi:MAG: dihydropteroate synthase, partial [Geopsychrobacter sp.]|nr:dihydropteroate synthase [Geopsychrobacter sp.]
PEKALTQARKMIQEGADLLDIGGESTRPGAPAVSTQVEQDRVLPVIEALRRESDIPISIDTSKADVAAQALAVGANFINDISGLQFDGQMATVAASSGAGIFLMHPSGRPEVMQRQTVYADLLVDVLTFLQSAAAKAVAEGVPTDAVAIDPGIGFGKDLEGNLLLLKHLDRLVACGYPVLLGTSRKSFIGQILQRSEPSERLAGTLASVALGVERGVQIFRVHDVRPAREAALVAWAVREGVSPVAID